MTTRIDLDGNPYSTEGNLKGVRSSESDLSALLAVDADKTAGVIITQFMLFMQQKSIWPCHQFIGDDPQPLTPDEAMKLKREYVQLLKDT